jgi:hypothetical protein
MDTSSSFPEARLTLHRSSTQTQVAELVRDTRARGTVLTSLNLRRRAGHYAAELVRDTREGRAERRRHHLHEVDGDDTPGALHAKLHAERARCEAAEGAHDDPQRDEDRRQEREGTVERVSESAGRRMRW